MSKPIATLLMAAAVTIGLMCHPGPGVAAPAANAYAIGKVPASNLEIVRWYGGGWHGGGWRGGGWGYYGGGFAAGAILGECWRTYIIRLHIMTPATEEGQPDGAVDYRMRRFRSYDPGVGRISATMATSSLSMMNKGPVQRDKKPSAWFGALRHVAAPATLGKPKSQPRMLAQWRIYPARKNGMIV